MEFQILDESSWIEIGDEQLGTKSKVWLGSPDNQHWLFKRPRPQSGEHWAEKLAAEIAERLGVPAARVEVARRGDELGSLSHSFARSGTYTRALHLGNELCFKADPTYEREKRRPATHTVDRILALLEKVAAPDGCRANPCLQTAADKQSMNSS